MTYAYLGIGSNEGPLRENMEQAVELLSNEMSVVDVSSLYDCAPLYVENQPRFLNLVLKIYTQTPLRPFLGILQDIERKMGKNIPFKNGPRKIDIDLLFFGDLIEDQPDLKIPHPNIQERRFVLEPLSEIAPSLVHPVLKKTTKEMLASVLGQDVKKAEGEMLLFKAQSKTCGKVEEAEKLIFSVGVEDLYSIKTMAQKSITRVVHLHGVRATMANILKQEMLSLGVDAAVHKDCISNQTDHSEVLLIGNLKQLRQLISKLRVQVAEARQVAKAVEKAIA